MSSADGPRDYPSWRLAAVTQAHGIACFSVCPDPDASDVACGVIMWTASRKFSGMFSMLALPVQGVVGFVRCQSFISSVLGGSHFEL